MRSDELGSLQAPLKEKYRTSPETAMITLRAEGRLGEGVSCSVSAGKALIEARLHSAAGDSGL